MLLGVIFIATSLSIFAIPEDLLDDRFKFPVQKAQPLADKIVLIAFIFT